MSIDITFTLSDEDLEQFEDIVVKARNLVQETDNESAVMDEAKKMIEQTRHGNLPGFINERLLKLGTLLEMVQDEEWKLEEEERRGILAALSYFALCDDLIPDHIPGVGFLDDALYAEIIIQELDSELRSYKEFCQFRSAEENRRINRGLDPKIGREDWLADKRSVLHSRMRARRTGDRSGHRWRAGIL